MSTRLLGFVLPLLLAACGVTIHHETDVAAPQHFRPQGAADQWLIEGKLDTEIHQDHDAGTVRIASRILKVTINGEPAVEGPLPADAVGNSTGTLDGTYGESKIHIDCSSQQKSADWIEIRCRVLVNGEAAVTLVM